MALTEEDILALDQADPRSPPIDTMGILDRATHHDPDRSARVVDISKRREIPHTVAELELGTLGPRAR